MTTKMSLEDLKSFIKENEGPFGVSRLTMREIAEIAKENELVKIHSFELNLHQNEYHACEQDEENLHFVFDYNGYLHGVNIDFFSRSGSVDWSDVGVISHETKK